MELWEEMLLQMLKEGCVEIKFSTTKNIENKINSGCYKALQQIKDIIKNDSLTDKDCFMKIEEIICVLEEIGSNGGNRHDF